MKRRFHESAKIEISDYQNVENLFVWSLVPFNRGFHDSGKSHFRDSKINKISPIFARYLETLISRICRNRIFRLPKCGKFDNTKLGILEHGFHDSAKPISRLQKLSKFPLFARYLETLVSRIGRNRIFRLPECGRFGNTENSLTRNLVPLKRVFHYWAKRIFRPQKLRKFPLIARYLEMLVSRIVRNHIFRMQKCVKFAHTMLGSLEPWVSRLGKNRIF